MASRFPVQKMCKALGVSRSGYYAHLKKPKAARKARDQQLKPKVRQSFSRSKGRYGSPRIMMELRREGERCGKNRVARLMREEGLRQKQAPLASAHYAERSEAWSRAKPARPGAKARSA